MYILIVDDDPMSLELARFVLRSGGHEIEAVDNPRGALRLIERRLPNLLLLDVNMPEMDGFTFSQRLKSDGYHIPFIFLTSRTDLEDRLRGFALQADDYICKPYHPQELLARVGVAARHQGAHQPAQHIQAGPLELIPEHLQVIVNGTKPVSLTPTEMQVLLLLMTHAGRVVKREQFFTQIWKEESSNVLDAFIRRLRGKLGVLGKSIVCVRGLGYSFQIP